MCLAAVDKKNKELGGGLDTRWSEEVGRLLLAFSLGMELL